MENKALTLLELNQNIRKVVKEHTTTCWIIAEINELKVNYSGHCYLELIQKDENSDQIVARSKATIWASFFRMIKPYFESTTGQSLNSGLRIMVKVTAEFHELYGISLNITDIEPTYTVGELAIRRQKIIQQLYDEGVIDMNKELQFPYLCHKIAVISSASAAGYEDFTDQLLNNQTGYKFYVKLFPAAMQGADAEESIISALEKIYEYEHFFDVVVIIRGGGSKTDLGCFDNYRLAYYITQFPLPVITGIGHEQDDSVTDIVAHTRLKTPTAVASFLIDQMEEHDGNLQLLQEQFFQKTTEITDENKDYIYQKARDLQLILTRLTSVNKTELIALQHKMELEVRNAIFKLRLAISKKEASLSQIIKNAIAKDNFELLKLKSLIQKSVLYCMDSNRTQIDRYARQIYQLDPNRLLKRGYSVTMKNGKLLTNSNDTVDGDIVETILFEGKLISKIKK
jgi:exodeoxyribonuclease VII large subunit